MATAATKAPTTEIGNVSSWVQLSGWPYDPGEETAALIWPESVRTYSRMRTNSTVHSVLTAVMHPLRRPGIFKLSPQGARPEIVAQLAEDLDLAVIGQDRPPLPRRRGRFSWLEHVRLALLGLTYGHMGFEFLCDPVALKETGQARLAKLAPRFPHSISHIDTDDHGDLAAIRQWSTVRSGFSGPEVTIPLDRLVWYANEREGAVYQGRSILRPCYGDWLLLDRLLRVRAMLMERAGMGIPVGVAPPGAEQDVIDLMGDIAAKARAGDSSGVGIPNGADLRWKGVEGTLPDVGAAIADHKAALADAVMASFMRLGTADASGNRALGQTFVDQFTQSEDTIAGWIADTATCEVVERLVDLNWGPEEPAPAIVARPIDAETHIDPLQLFRLVQVGAIQPDPSLDAFLRTANQLPQRSSPWVGSKPALPTTGDSTTGDTGTDTGTAGAVADENTGAAG